MKTNSTTGDRPGQSNSELPPLRHVGRWKPQAVYVRGQRDKHAIYDRLISLLENRQAVNAKTGKVMPYIFSAEVRDALIKAGLTPLAISQMESETLDAAEIHPNWDVQRDFPKALYRRRERTGTEHLIHQNRIVAVPNLLLNALVCLELLTMFSKTELLLVDGFVSRPDGRLRLDIDVVWSRRGFIVPIYSGQLINRLKVYRHPDDTRPFILKRRRARVDA